MTCKDCEYGFFAFVSDETDNVCKTVLGWLKPLVPSKPMIATFFLGVELATFELHLIRLLGAAFLIMSMVRFIYTLGQNATPKPSPEWTIEQPRWEQ